MRNVSFEQTGSFNRSYRPAGESMQIAMRQTVEGSQGERPVSFGDQLYFMSAENRARQSSHMKKNLFSNDLDQNKNNAIEQNKASDKGSNHE